MYLYLRQWFFFSALAVSWNFILMESDLIYLHLFTKKVAFDILIKILFCNLRIYYSALTKFHDQRNDLFPDGAVVAVCQSVEELTDVTCACIAGC